MKVFWALFLVLALAAGGMLFLRARGGDGVRTGEIRVSTTPAPAGNDDERLSGIVAEAVGGSVVHDAGSSPENTDGSGIVRAPEQALRTQAPARNRPAEEARNTLARNTAADNPSVDNIGCDRDRLGRQ